MKDKITVIITIRNREAHRIRDQVNSIREHGADPSFHIIDYGSDKTYSSDYRKVCAELGLRYTHMYSEGLPWNKCRAINYGAKTAQTPYIATSDVDMLYTSNPFQWCLDNYAEKKMYHIRGCWMDKTGKREKAKDAGPGNYGFYQFIGKNAFDRTGGYDERIVYWGQEDHDWPARLKKTGYEMVWLPEPHRLYHQWHKPSESGRLRPETAFYNTMRFCYENTLHPVLKQDYGQALEKKDRPILETIEDTDPYTVEFRENSLIHWENFHLLTDTKKQSSFVKCVIGPRIKKRPLEKMRPAACKLIKPVTALTGISVSENINHNFDCFYAVLPVLQDNGLRDYYIGKDMSFVCLLWE